MAPNFDNNMALISRGYAEDPVQSPNEMANQFLELLAAEGISYRFPALEVSVVRDIAGGVMPGAKIDREHVVQFMTANFKKLTR